MLSSKVILVQFVVVACLAGLVVSAGLDSQVDLTDKSVTGFVCEGCMKLATEAKTNAPVVEDLLRKLCDHQSCPDNKAKCNKALDDFSEKVKTETPFKLCQDMGLCKV